MARDTYHQHQWAAAIEELEAEGLEATPVPIAFPKHLERSQNNHQLWNFSKGDESREGRWMKIQVDGKPIEYVQNPQPLSEAPELGPGHPKLYNTTRETLTVGASNGRPM